jgi:inhibitor of cysteine peptidase
MAALAPPVFAATYVFTGAEKGATVHLKLDDLVELRLKSNPTTGYAWSVHPQSTPLLKLVADFTTPPTQPGVGRPVFQIFRFKAVGKGEGVLLLHYVRSWEKPSGDEERFDLRVVIQ